MRGDDNLIKSPFQTLYDVVAQKLSDVIYFYLKTVLLSIRIRYLRTNKEKGVPAQIGFKTDPLEPYVP